MIFKRKAYELLLEWKKGNGKSAVLIEGARRTGKSTLAEEFAHNEYASSLLINFETAPEAVKSIFNDYRNNVDEFFKYLLAYYGVRLKERDALIVFDEVQRFPVARSFIKQLVADGRYDYMETGSLISIKKNVEDIIIPSEEDKVELWPFDFEEFLWARGDEQLAALIADAFVSKKPLPEALHKRAGQIWREYLLVGGMPQSVNSYLESNDFAVVDATKRRILNLYREDIMKFGGDDASRATAIFNAVPGQLAKHEKKFTLAAAHKNARYREYAGAFFWLADAHMVNTCLNVTDPTVGLDLSAEEDNLKCYLCDTGLLATMAFGDRRKTSNELYQNVLFGKLNINEGMLTENIVAQQLAVNGHRLRFYSRRDKAKSQETMEIDFLLVREYENAAFKQRVSPVEVKSSTRFSTKSLDKFKAKFNKRVGTEFVLSPRVLKKEGDRFFVPLYMSFCL
ncbi:ATP-binding protein [Adlercreutzia sp. ZJ154]|uniref:ATP-binding protein n=1 Tax=Adlercreutzia sp. ZJ154 TaxID=2709790 RepID=UPI001F154F95|nr:AAA family ATPase [Adlercreutzia sp. ZJ154]